MKVTPDPRRYRYYSRLNGSSHGRRDFTSYNHVFQRQEGSKLKLKLSCYLYMLLQILNVWPSTKLT